MKRIALVLSCIILAITANSQTPKQINVNAGKLISDVSPVMWGVFFEDINFAADGGLNSELIKNRSFEFSDPMMGWDEYVDKGKGKSLVTFHYPANQANPRYLRLSVNAAGGFYGLANEGFRGIGLKQGAKYNFSLSASLVEGKDLGLTIELVSPSGELLGSSVLSGFGKGWKTFESVITSGRDEGKASLRLKFSGTGVINIDLVSLTPVDTWKGRKAGLRKDIATMIADMKPGFVRFPGGCIVEGRDLTNRYQWKNTVGPLDQRRLFINRWNTEMRDRQAPDYFQSFGLGFYEYFLFSEDIGAEPLPILNCGMSCQFNSAEVVPIEALDQYIKDALDLVEFANGPVTSEWGALRASMGHPAPFNLKYMGIGNEQWDVQYIERYKEFEKVLKARHPEIRLVSGAGPYAGGELFDYAWAELRKLSPDLVDEHYYMAPEWFLRNAGRYDKYPRTGPKVFAGEYAAHWKSGDRAESRNTWYSALAEAAFMTGLERNADVVRMASYAPLLAHVDAWQWRPDLIWFDNSKVFGTPNYHVQKLFSSNKGTDVIQVLAGGLPVSGADSLYASGTIDRNNGLVILKIVNSSISGQQVRFVVDGVRADKIASITTLKSGKKSDFNSIDNPVLIVPAETTAVIKNGKIDVSLSPLSVNILTFKYKK
ncbi:MAG: alpha-L-arabinofuranosidase C-terminal domain-containing protein [Bacteroidales bacterium]